MNKLKYTLIAAFVIASSYIANAQNSVGIGTTTPDTNAVLHLVSKNGKQGLLVPKVNITTFSYGAAQEGMLVYDLPTKKFYFWSGSAWTEVGGSIGLPIGTTGQTLRHNGTDWVVSSNLYNDGTNVGVGVVPTELFQVGEVGGVGPLMVDQSVSPGTGVWTSFPVWQSFTAGANGTLEEVGFNLNWAGFGFDIKIYDGEGVGGTLLKTQSYTSLAGFNSYAFTTGVPIVSGNKYTFQLEGTNNVENNHWNIYAGGYSSANASYDIVFTTKYRTTGNSILFNVNSTTNRVGVGASSPSEFFSVGGTSQFRVTETGDLSRIKDLFYSWPSTHVSGMLTNDGSGNLSWSAGSSANIYNTNGTLSANRIVTQGANLLSFTSTATNGFSVDGTTFSVDAANNRIGIGTASPSATLNISRSTGTGSVFLIQSTDNTLGSDVVSIQSNATGNGINISSTGSGPAARFTSATSSDGVYIQNTGSGNALTVSSSNTTAGTRYGVYSTASSAATSTGIGGYFSSTGVGTNYAAIFDKGNVGVNTTTPTAKLHVEGTSMTTLRIVDGNQAANKVLTSDLNGYAYWALPAVQNNIYNADGVLSANRTVNQSTFTLGFTTGIANGFSVDGTTFSIDGLNNRVGIGTASPLKTLHVLGNGILSEGSASPHYIQSKSTMATGWSGFQMLSPSAIQWTMAMQNNTEKLLFSNSSGDKVVFDATGNVGIGYTAPTSILHLRQAGAPAISIQSGDNITVAGTNLGRVDIGDASSTAQASIIGIREQASSGATDLPSALSFSTIKDGNNALTERMRISSTGWVGIGTTNPLEMLAVGSLSQFRVADNGDISRIKDLFYSWPAAQASGVLTNDGTGTLSWSAPSSTNIYNTDGTLSANRTVTQGANLLSFTSSATNGFSIDGTTFSVDALNDRIGLGTTSPQNHLSVFRVNDANMSLSTQGAGTGDDISFNFQTLNNATGSLSMGVTSTKGWALGARGNAWATVGEQNMFFAAYWDGAAWKQPLNLLPNGNVGINTLTPNSTFTVGSTNGFRIDNAGKVGINIAPATWASININNVDAGGNGIYSGAWGTSGEKRGVTGIAGNAGTNIGGFFSASGGTSNYALIADLGNVGIGTLTPTYKLHVVGTAGLSTGTAWTLASDLRLKDLIGDYEYGLDEVLKLHTVRFNYKENNPLGLQSDNVMVGFIAQEVQVVIPEAVNKREDGFLEINVDPIHWAVVNSVKELNNKIEINSSILLNKVEINEFEKLKLENEKLKNIINQMSSENASLKSDIELIKQHLGIGVEANK